MSEPRGWDQVKNTIRSLYLIQGHPLEGPDGLIKVMANKYGFTAT